ncbi:GntR family transcriptional regulator [Planctomycetota bacterium]|nr:GntR family transcriptional regulator [Planctomycetota bacterium]
MSDKPLQIDHASDIPVYRQITDDLRARLVSGQLPPGTRLPPVRQLAADLTVHHNTVAQAYRQLAEEGWLSLKRGRGVQVIPRHSQTATPEDETWFSQRFTDLLAKAKTRGLTQSQLTQIIQNLTST